jgi:hypothetical protein
VFDQVKKHPAVKPFNNDIGLPTELDEHMYTFFDTAVRENRYYSEDWTFCENWRDIGGKVFVDSRVLLKHTGHFNFCHENDDQLRKDYAVVQSSVNLVPDQPEATIEIPEPKEKIETIASSKKKPKKK